MFLQFVPKTHLFFTAGKDRKIKQWDADKFEHIQTLEVTSCLARSYPGSRSLVKPSAPLRRSLNQKHFLPNRKHVLQTSKQKFPLKLRLELKDRLKREV